jgi:phosphate transport system permease protein
MEMRRKSNAENPPGEIGPAGDASILRTAPVLGRPSSIRWLNLTPARFLETVVFLFFRLCSAFILAALLGILFQIVRYGGSRISWEFLSQPPREGMLAGGILSPLLGTLAVSLITIFFSLPFGVATGVYLSEYAGNKPITWLVRLCIRNLAGVPSIVYGLFGVALFVRALHLGTSILSAGLTLGLLTLPVIITASEEALRAVPASYREGALALGATRWYTIRTNVLPYAMPGILTGIILGVARAAGETAPILFTGAAFFLPSLPRSIWDQFMALPYHLYILSTQHQSVQEARPIAYATALVLLGLVLALNSVAILIRLHFRKKLEHV